MHRRDVDDAAAMALFDHFPGGQLAAEEGALDIHAHDQVELVFGGTQEVSAGLHAGIVDHDIQPSEGFDGVVDKRLDIVDDTDVALHDLGSAATLLDLLKGILGGVLVVMVIDGHGGAGAGQRHADGMPNAAVAPSYNSYAVGLLHVGY